MKITIVRLGDNGDIVKEELPMKRLLALHFEMDGYTLSIDKGENAIEVRNLDGRMSIDPIAGNTIIVRAT